MTVYLILNGNYSPVPGMLESEKDWHLSLLFNPESLEAVTDTNLQLIVCEDGHTGVHWTEYAKIARTKNAQVFFILLADNISAAEAYTQGADLVVATSDKGGLTHVVKQFFYRRQQQMLDDTKTSPDVHTMMSEMQRKNRELEKVSFELDRFVYSASHDLRAPLTSILGLLYLLRDDTKDDNTLHYIRLMEDSILKLDNTIKDIVAYSRNSRSELSSEPIELSVLVGEILSSLRYLENPDLILSEIVHVDLVDVFYADRNRLQVILNNLLSNSIRYRHPERQPDIRIHCEVLGNEIRLVVSDNGIGISERHIDRIFDMFYRSNEGSTGSGLGLYIVRETIRKMNGTIQVESEQGKSTVFTITIPQFVEVSKKELV